MASKVIRIYECDICHSQFRKSSDLFSCSLPINDCKDNKIITKRLDLCEECYRMAYEVIRNEFAEINLAMTGLVAEKKFNKGVRVRKILNEGT